MTIIVHVLTFTDPWDSETPLELVGLYSSEEKANEAKENHWAHPNYDHRFWIKKMPLEL